MCAALVRQRYYKAVALQSQLGLHVNPASFTWDRGVLSSFSQDSPVGIRLMPFLVRVSVATDRDRGLS